MNDLASKNNSNSGNHRNTRNSHNTHHHAHRNQSGGGGDDSDSVHCVSYNIPSPHRAFDSGRSSPLPYGTALHDIDNAINLDNYNPGVGNNVTTNIDGDGDDNIQNEFSDSVESIDSDDLPANADASNEGGAFGGQNNRHHSPPVRRRNDSVTYDPQMSPVYGSSVVYAGQPRGRLEVRQRRNNPGRLEHRSRSPPNTNNRQGLNRRVTNNATTTSTSSGRNNNNRRHHHHQSNYVDDDDDEDYDGIRVGSQSNAVVDDGLVLRIGVSRTVSDSSASASSSSTDSDTD